MPRILLVEDEQANRELFRRRLERKGHAVVVAENGLGAVALAKRERSEVVIMDLGLPDIDGCEALDAVRGGRFDLVLLNLTMPGVDGYEVLRQVKADPDLRAVPVIVLSALDEAAGVARCIEMGAEDYLQKPYDPAILTARISACLDKRRLRDRELDIFRAAGELTRAAEALERGQYDPEGLAEVVARTDALGTLARAFDRMAREVLARDGRRANPAETSILPKLK